MSAPISMNYAQKLRRDGAGFYLSELRRDFLNGEVVLHIGGKKLAVPDFEFVEVEIDLLEKNGAYRIEIGVS